MQSSIIIAPSLLSANFLNLGDEVGAFSTAQNLWFHLDIMDSHFVPNLTFGPIVLEKVSTITKHPLDAHFMVTNPDFFISEFRSIGLHNFTFHWEASIHHDRLITEAKKYYPSVGISLNPSTPLSLIPDYILQKIDLVLLMSVNPGFGGQSFIPAIVGKVAELNLRKQQLGAKFHIQVDGGVSNQNAGELVRNGATNLVAGSYIFKAGKNSYLKQVESLRS